jgi:metal-sulfur cluster biosynthetic enzyme
MKLKPNEIAKALENVYDPELGVDIVSLGFLYSIVVDDDNVVIVTITLTVPGCPLHIPITEDIREKIIELGAKDVYVDVVWDPPWNPSMMSEEARKRLLGE